MEQSLQVLEWQAEAAKRTEKQTLVEIVLRVLHLRFGTTIPAELEATIRGAKDRTQLNRWLEVAVTASSLEEFPHIVTQ